MPELKPGEDWEPLPDGTSVFRLAAPTMDGDVLPGQLRFNPDPFTLSSADKAESPSRLSVWECSLATPAQAWRLMGSKSKYRIILVLRVADIRALKPLGDPVIVPGLDVVWYPLATDEHGRRVRQTPAGADGHSGITNLNPEIHKGDHAKMLQAKRLRSLLIEITRPEVLVTESG